MKKKVLIGVGLVVAALFMVKEWSKVGKSKVEGSSVAKAILRPRSGQVADGVIKSVDATSPSHLAIDPERGAQAITPAKVAFTKEDQLSDPVKALLGLDGKVHNYPELLQAIGMLSKDLSVVDVAALRELLTFSNDQFPEKMRDIEINAVKNDVLDKLLRQTELPEGLGLQIAEMAGNADNDSVWRDYCVQFMEPFWERKSKVQGLNVEGQEDESAQSVDELSVIHDMMLQALEERSETIAGTSLIGLELLSRTHDEFDRELITEKTIEVASDESASASCRLTAMRLAAGLTTENTETIQVARNLAQTGETFLLRSAAIVTLGEIGTADDRELLESFTFSENKQIVAAAKMALGKMEGSK